MIHARTRLLLLMAAFVAVGCGQRKLTRRLHVPDRDCVVTSDGSSILCGGQIFASLACRVRLLQGCAELTLHYADGDIAKLYKASGDPKFDKAIEIVTASDGSRLWFLEIEGLFGSRQWHVYDVRSGVLKKMGQGEVDAEIKQRTVVPLKVTESPNQSNPGGG